MTACWCQRAHLIPPPCHGFRSMNVCAGSTNKSHMHMLSLQCYPFSISLDLSPHSTAFVLHSIIPRLQSGMGKKGGKLEFYNNHFPLL